MASLASEQISARIARDRREFGADSALDPTQRALEIMAKQGLKLVKTPNRAPRESKFRLDLRLALLKLRLFSAQARYVVLCNICRLLGEPKQPTMKSTHGGHPL